MAKKKLEKKKRGSKRYAYTHMASCEIGGNYFEVQIFDISRSGAQIGSKIRIDTKDPVRVMWKDEKFGAFEINLLIVREIHKPKNNDFQFFYGAQFFNLSPENKQRLPLILYHFKEMDKHAIINQVKQITPGYLFEVIEEGERFLQRAVQGGKTPVYFDSLLQNITENEKQAFSHEDEYSKCIQKNVTHNFHCNILGMLSGLVAQENNLQPVFFRHILIELEKIAESEKETDDLLKKILEDKEQPEADKRSMQIKINESNNRLFYTKQGLLQSVMETFGHLDPETVEFGEVITKVKDEYDRIMEFTGNVTTQSESNINIRRSKKPQEYSKVETVIDVPMKAGKKPSFFMWFSIAVILFFVGIVGYSKYENHQEKLSLKEQMGLPIDIIDFKIDPPQIELVFLSSEWKKFSEKTKQDILENIGHYLKNQKNLRVCSVIDENKTPVKVVYKE